MSVGVRRSAVVVSTVLLVSACSVNGDQGQSGTTAAPSSPVITSVAMTDATKAPATTTTPATATRSTARASTSPTPTPRRTTSTTKPPKKSASELLKSLSPARKKALLDRYRSMTPAQQREARRQACAKYGVGC